MEKKIIFAFLTLACLFSCKKAKLSREEFFYLKNKNAYLSVWSRGNLASPWMILVLHGGPGGNDGVYMNSQAFQTLERQYHLIYYDQRGSGASQSTWLRDYTLDDHIDDLDKLLVLLRQKYPLTQKIILLGHSWGGMLGSFFLERGRMSRFVDLWLNVDGSVRTVGWEERDFLLQTAQQQIQLGNSVDFWQKLSSQVSTYTQATITNLSMINSWGFRAERQLQKDKVIFPARGFDFMEFYFNSAYHAGIYALNEVFLNTLMFQQAFKKRLDITTNIAQLKTPTCLIWGFWDHVVASSLMLELEQKLPNLKMSRYLLGSGHSPMLHEPELFVETIEECFRIVF